MDIFIKIVGGIWITVILGLALQKQGKDFTVLLTIAACCMIISASFHFLSPIVSFLYRLKDMAQLDNDLLGVLLKTVGIALLAELSSLICSDAGNATLGKTIQIIAAGVILWLSIPLFDNLLSLIQKILGET